MRWIKVVIIFVVIFAIAGGGWYWKIRVVENKDKYELFAGEVWETIKTNYWEKVEDKDLAKLFLLATKRAAEREDITLISEDKKGVEILIKSIEDKSKVPLVMDMVLANLAPFERSRLYSIKEQKSLANNVNNVNPGSDYFSQLGVDKNATDEEVEKVYAKVTKTPEIEQAYKVLKDEDSRKMYQVSGVEPTIDYRLIGESVFYMHLTKFSPTSLEEFARVTEKVDDRGPELNSLILDLRGNIGGAIDGLPYFLGPFIGIDSYAYQFYQQGEKKDFKTLIGWMNSLVRYKKVVILIDENSQSTAEVMAATLKKYNVGVVMGTTTKGWGTVERVFELKNQISDTEKYSLFLVHHITLREDGQPIEGRGVDPMISIKDPNWKKELLARFGSSELVRAVENVYKGI
jgi:hypothetical protein